MRHTDVEVPIEPMADGQAASADEGGGAGASPNWFEELCADLAGGQPNDGPPGLCEMISSTSHHTGARTILPGAWGLTPGLVTGVVGALIALRWALCATLGTSPMHRVTARAVLEHITGTAGIAGPTRLASVLRAALLAHVHDATVRARCLDAFDAWRRVVKILVWDVIPLLARQPHDLWLHAASGRHRAAGRSQNLTALLYCLTDDPDACHSTDVLGVRLAMRRYLPKSWQQILAAILLRGDLRKQQQIEISGLPLWTLLEGWYRLGGTKTLPAGLPELLDKFGEVLRAFSIWASRGRAYPVFRLLERDGTFEECPVDADEPGEGALHWVSDSNRGVLQQARKCGRVPTTGEHTALSASLSTVLAHSAESFAQRAFPSYRHCWGPFWRAVAELLKPHTCKQSPSAPCIFEPAGLPGTIRCPTVAKGTKGDGLGGYWAWNARRPPGDEEPWDGIRLFVAWSEACQSHRSHSYLLPGHAAFSELEPVLREVVRKLRDMAREALGTKASDYAGAERGLRFAPTAASPLPAISPKPAVPGADPWEIARTWRPWVPGCGPGAGLDRRRFVRLRAPLLRGMTWTNDVRKCSACGQLVNNLYWEQSDFFDDQTLGLGSQTRHARVAAALEVAHRYLHTGLMPARVVRLLAKAPRLALLSVWEAVRDDAVARLEARLENVLKNT